ncbi:MAG: hypothetical protein LH479_12965, partial [Polaromonas sp.]|nr:hypothetical protein [Polaromonas sp.]
MAATLDGSPYPSMLRVQWLPPACAGGAGAIAIAIAIAIADLSDRQHVRTSARPHVRRVEGPGEPVCWSQAHQA